MITLTSLVGRGRTAARAAVFCAVVGGAALVTATGVLLETGLRSHLPVGRLAGADVVVSASQSLHPSGDLAVPLPERAGVPAALAAELRTLPGVTAAVADVSFPAALVDGRGTVPSPSDAGVSGHGWSSVQLLDDLRVTGSPPRGGGQVALGTDLASAAAVVPGDRLRAVVAGVTGDYQVSAVVGAGAGILVADEVADRMAMTGGRRSADLVGLRVRKGATDTVRDAVERRVAAEGLVVSTGSARGDVSLPEASASRSLLVVLAASMGGVPMLVIGIVVAGAVSTSIAGQRTQLALLRAVGMTPRELRHSVAGQASTVALAALVPGIALGYLVAGQFRHLLVTIGLLPAELPLTLSPLPAVAGIAVLLGVVQVAARCASWRLSREPVTLVLGEARTGSRQPSRARTTSGLVALVAALPLAVTPLFAPTAAGSAATALSGILAAIGLALAGPALLPRVTGPLLRALPARFGAPTWLAAANLHGYALRSAGALTTLATAVLVVLTYTLSGTTLASAADREAQAATRSDVTLTAAALGGVPGSLLADVRETPGVQAAAAVSSTTLVWPTTMFGEESLETQPALVLTPAAEEVLDLGVRDGSLSGLTGATVAVGSDAARSHSAELGSTVGLVLGDGTPVRARVVAVYERSLGLGSVALSADLAAGHLTSGLAEQLLVRTDGSPQARSALDAVVLAHPGVVLTDNDAGSAGQRVAPEVWVNVAVLGVLLGYLLLGVLNSLLAAGNQRRGEIDALRMIGMTPRHVRATVRREAALLTAGALVSGVLLSVIPLSLLGIGFLGRPWAAGPAWLLPATVAVVTAIAVGAAEVSTRAALRTPAGRAAHAA